MFNCILNLDYHIIDLVELAIYIDLAELVRRCNLSVQRERERERELYFPTAKFGRLVKRSKTILTLISFENVYFVVPCRKTGLWWCLSPKSAVIHATKVKVRDAKSS
jgi:hypothetical protein